MLVIQLSDSFAELWDHLGEDLAVPVRQAAIPAGADVRADHVRDLLGGVTVLRARAIVPDPQAGVPRDALYGPAASQAVTLTAIPYFAWDNRAPGEMLVWMPETLALVTRGEAKKGDVLATARIAGIMAAKKTHELIPLCHPLAISKVTVEFAPSEQPAMPATSVWACSIVTPGFRRATALAPGLTATIVVFLATLIHSFSIRQSSPPW